MRYNKHMQNQPPTTGAPSTPTPAVGPDPTNPVMPNVAVPGATAPSTSITPSASTASSPASTPNLTSTPSGSVVAPAAAQPFGPAAPGSAASPTPLTPHASTPKSSPIPPPPKSNRGLIEMIILVVTSLLAVTFIGLFIWKYIEWDTVKTDIDGQIDAAVAVAVSENTTQLEKDFLEREKYPYKSFMGPADYGSLGFEYPKTWNVYIAKDASNGGDFEAYLNPGEVQPVSARTINALRVTIQDKAFDSVVRNYDSYVRNGRLNVVTRNIGNAVANVYTGELPNDIHGILAIFKLRDKTVLIQTDAELFADEYYKLLDTVTFVE